MNAQTRVESNGKLQIGNYFSRNSSNNDNVLFKTRGEVELNAGFEVAAGAEFEISVDPDNIINCN
jgi:hypothetical protein